MLTTADTVGCETRTVQVVVRKRLSDVRPGGTYLNPDPRVGQIGVGCPLEPSTTPKPSYL